MTIRDKLKTMDLFINLAENHLEQVQAKNSPKNNEGTWKKADISTQTLRF